MEHLTPAELLRFLEEEATTLEQVNAKIAHQLHILQVEADFFNRQLSNLEKERAPPLQIESCQSEQSEELEVQSTAHAGSTEQEVGSSPMLLQIQEPQNCSGENGQEPGETIELENNPDQEMQLQGQQQEQEVQQVKETPPPQRASGRRAARRPARFQD